MGNPDLNQINELIAELDRIAREAQELRRKIAILTEERRSRPARRQQSLRYSALADVNDSTTPPVPRLRK